MRRPSLRRLLRSRLLRGLPPLRRPSLRPAALLASSRKRLASARGAAAGAARRLEGAPVLGPLLRGCARVADAVTPLGRASAVGLVLALACAAALHWLEAWGAALVLAALLAMGALAAVGLTTYRVSVELASTRVTVGDAALGQVVLTNPSARRVGASTVELPVGEGLAAFRVPRLGAGESHEEPFTIPTRRRGVVVVGPVTSIRGDWLGIVRRKQRWNEPVDLYVHPRTTALDSDAIGFIRDVEGAVTQELSSSDVAFHALRDYVPGDDRRNVHWRSTARTGRLMVRQFEETRRAHLLVILDLDEAAYGTDEELETAVSCAASLIIATMREGREVSLVTQTGAPPLTTAVRALDALTTLKAVADQENLARLTRRAVAAVPQASVTALLTGSRTPAERIHRARVELPVSTQPLALRVDAAASLHSTPIADIRVLTVPRLDALPRAMRRAVR